MLCASEPAIIKMNPSVFNWLRIGATRPTRQHVLKRFAGHRPHLQFRQYQWKTGVYGHKPKESNRVLGDKCIFDPKNDNAKLYPLVAAYREHGHKKAQTNPANFSTHTLEVPELNLNCYGLNSKEKYSFDGLLNDKQDGTVDDAVQWLEDTYCGKISVEFTHLDNLDEREWFQKKYEEVVHKHTIDHEYEKENLKVLLQSQTFENFLKLKFVTLKRYSGEGAESALSFFLELFNIASLDGVTDIVVAAHHRGRLSFITGLLGMPPEILFRKVRGKSEFPPEYTLNGDVISHLCPSATLKYNGKEINVRMTNLPSHLEAVCPVSLGQTRALQQLKSEGDYGKSNGRFGDQVLNVQVHGDASLMGQGVSQESLIMSCLPHFQVGGSVHLIINNQVGFTTPPSCGRGTRYASDVAKIISAPVLHVNGDFPNEVIKATRIAMDYQRKFRKTIFIDLICYRKWGHNEVDDPTFTNPSLYRVINSKSTVPDMYAAYLINKKVTTKEEVNKIENDYSKELNKRFHGVDSFVPQVYNQELWSNYRLAPNAVTSWDTGLDTDLLRFIGEKSVEAPEKFPLHPNLVKNHIQSRLSKLQSGNSLDWGTCEALAIGSLLYQGFNVRICGQDVGRGTFAHRHAIFVNHETDDVYVPLNNISPEQHGHLEIANSHLSEEAALGFEYGFSSISPINLVIWEAQFGDFFNGAQIQIDTYITSGEDKWLTQSGIVLSLPHGYDGAGPEHSSCRMERFLQLSNSDETKPDGDSVNIHVVYPTTAAQYFHLLRRQMIRNFRKPLIVVGPKIIIRAPEASSSLHEMGPNTSFIPVIGDRTVTDEKKIHKILLVSGKHYFPLNDYKEKNNITDTAIIRVEQLVPFPVVQLRDELAKFSNVKEYVWAQEEPQNMGAWTFMKPRFENLIGKRLKFVGRPPYAAPAVGIGEIHKKEAQYVIEQPFKMN
ncbi:probable 2-oxoglutarate dehydrogenase E1 component DHKTD1, mitochondrial [Cimex lectularius]|uniref:Transketolase-like pyrimidine-binding domain-containing protein n=1 Tax=Cimex lectularius TaxID=79782 RepID=A0A8I6RS30_CIMLE|nr:probable 2-oxoglutarate dehydrogenase E1 component DHKTD1, mitochondrial [Cimex lectularius]XP_014250512.1 probable 2-oxoglutarate dehydrogenase E1 component DHKTD1, mitochondrial [Cimex lectularius]